MPEGCFVLFRAYAVLSSNSGVLGNGCPIHYINTFCRFPIIAQHSKGVHYFHRVVGLVVYLCQ